MTKKYDWDRLERQGQVMWVDGVKPQQVSKLVKANVLRRLGPRALVVTAYVEETDQTFVALAYVPSTVDVRAKDPEPRTEDPGLTDEERDRMMKVSAIRLKSQQSEPEPDPKDEWDDIDEDVG